MKTQSTMKLHRELRQAVPLMAELLKAKRLHSILAPTKSSPTWVVCTWSSFLPKHDGSNAEGLSLVSALRLALRETKQKESKR